MHYESGMALVGRGYYIWGNWVWLMVAGLLVVMAAGTAAGWLSRRQTLAGATTAQLEARGNIEGQIASMLIQNGGPLSQDRIREHLDLPVAEVARLLAVMESRGMITRQWMPMEYTYRVMLVEAGTDPYVAGPPATVDAGQG